MRRWNAIRFALGMTQMAAATVAAVLLFYTGVTTWSLMTAVIALRADDSQRAALRHAASRRFTALQDGIAIEPMTIGLSIPFVLLAGLVSAASLSAGCDSSRTTVQEILRRTIAPGDAVPTLSEPVRSGQSLQFTWDLTRI